MKTKTEQIKNAIIIDEWAVAFSIAKNFFAGFTKDEKKSIDIAHESKTMNSNFYESIGVDINREVNNAKSILKSKFL